jgi:hypothetical protein
MMIPCLQAQPRASSCALSIMGHMSRDFDWILVGDPPPRGLRARRAITGHISTLPHASYVVCPWLSLQDSRMMPQPDPVASPGVEL